MTVSKQRCEACGGEFMNLGVHARFCKKQAQAVTPEKSVPQVGVQPEVVGEESSSTSPTVRFLSPRSPELAIIVKHGRRTVFATERGAIEDVAEVKVAQFRNGVLETDDSDIINYLTRKYNDPRFPVVNASAVKKF